MAEIAIGGAMEALVVALLERRAAALRDAHLVLLVAEPAGAWRALGGAGLSHAELATAPELTALGERASHTAEPLTGGPLATVAAIPTGTYWCAADAWPTFTAPGASRAALIGLRATPFAPVEIAALSALAGQIAAALAGAHAALRERRESDQIALLMRYAANPIVLSDDATIVNMNDPAARLFAFAPADAEAEPTAIAARNLLRLRDFLVAAEQDPHDVHTGELELEDPASREALVMAIAASYVPTALGDTSGIVSVLHDMTRARELEQHRVRQQLFESEKLAATGRLAASIAHEINNPLEAIKNSLYLLVKQSAPADPNRRFLEVAQRETERVSRIVRQMLGVSRPSVAVAPTNVNDVLRDALQLLEPQLRQSRVEQTVQLDERMPLVMASADQLKQVFLNLVLNAREAMPDGGGLLIQTRLAHEGDAEFLAGNHVIVRIRDDGAGIPPDILPHVFEPFFSTKTDGHGTGLGLWVSQDILQQHGGHILVRSMVGKGTTFLVALPFIPIPDVTEGASDA